MQKRRKNSNLALKLDKMPEKENSVVQTTVVKKKLADKIKRKKENWQEGFTTKVEEPQVQYRSFKSDDFLKSTQFFNDKYEVVRLLNTGISTHQFLKIKENCPLTDTEWAAYLEVSIKTLQRYTKNDNYIFKLSHAEKMVELLEVMNFGHTVFDTNKQFYLWLKTPNYALGNSKPMDLIKNSYGKELVMEALNRIEYGIFV